MRSTSAVLALAVATLTIPSCAEERAGARAPLSGTDPAWPPAVRDPAWEEALGKIANATCDREQSCGTIGPGAYFKSREECLATVRDKTVRGVSQVDCPGGIDRGAFQSCLDSLEAGQCSAGADAITRSARCEASELCIRQ
jgi:hypothetical protein